MPPRLIPVDSSAPDAAVLADAAAVLRAGGLVAFPTETVYGLGANALDQQAVRGIYAAKGRPPGNPLIVHVAGNEMLDWVIADWPPIAQTLTDHYWPGPLTLVLPRAAGVPDEVTGGGPTVGVRMPAHPVALGLIRAAGVPVAAPSANRSTELSPTRAEHVWAGLGERVDVILDAGRTPNGIESTVLDLTTGPPTLLRPGPIPVASLVGLIGPVRRRTDGPAAGPMPSPGLMPRHYAPRTPVELFGERATLEQRADELRRADTPFGMVLPASAGPESVVLPDDPAGYASRLYDVLHELDGRGLKRILALLPPDTDDWLAVRDRLTRAAARGLIELSGV